MKSRSLLLSSLALLILRVASAAPLESPDTQISPQARAIIDRVNAAYSAPGSWSATIDREIHFIKDGAEPTVTPSRKIERYLGRDGAPGYYASTYYAYYARDFRPDHIIWQDGDAQYFVTGSEPGREQTFPARCLTSSASEENRPMPWMELVSTLGNAQYVKYNGKELVAGRSCDVLELITILWKPAAPGETKQPQSMNSERFYVDSAGFIVQIINAGDYTEKPSGYWTVWRVAYDVKARLTAADFSRENLDREATATVLRGEPMPESQARMFSRGDRLPEMTFTAWADKKPFRISDLQGKIVVVETWASWCHFCKEAFPYYEKTRQALVAQDVVFVAVSFDEKLANYEKWMNEHGDGYGFKFGRIEAKDPKKAMKEFKGSLPAFYVLGRDGRIVRSYSGYVYGTGGEDPRLLAALREAGVKL